MPSSMLSKIGGSVKGLSSKNDSDKSSASDKSSPLSSVLDKIVKLQASAKKSRKSSGKE